MNKYGFKQQGNGIEALVTGDSKTRIYPLYNEFGNINGVGVHYDDQAEICGINEDIKPTDNDEAHWAIEFNDIASIDAFISVFKDVKREMKKMHPIAQKNMRT